MVRGKADATMGQLVRPLTRCASLGKSVQVSVLQFSHLENDDKISALSLTFYVITLGR